MTEPRPGVVSVVLVNFRGSEDTIAAIAGLRELEWSSSRLEIIVVENGSGDGSAERIRSAVDEVILVESPENLGFAGGCNLGVSKSTGEYVAFLNNDAKPDRQWVAAAVKEFETSPTIGAVASRVLDWDGVLVDYIGSAMTWYGQGYKPMTGDPAMGLGGTKRDVLFGTGSAMFVRRSVFDALGGFDERYFMFFEDVDLGWRLTLSGLRFSYVPDSLAHHKHHASMGGLGAHKEHFLLERNALFTLYKNASDKTLREALPAAMALAVRRGLSRSGDDSMQFDLRRGGSDGDRTEIGSDAAAALFAIDRFTEELPGLTKDRHSIQSSRQVSDPAVWRLFGLADAPVYQEADYLRGYENITAAFDVVEAARETRVLIITGDPIGAKLAGPAIRAWNMASILSAHHDVTLMSSSRADRADSRFAIVGVQPGDDRSFARLERWADVIIFQGESMALFEPLRRTDSVLVVDIYDPMHLEQLEQARGEGAEGWTRAVSDATELLNEQLARGDFFLAASERQRHFYLGQLAALGRVNPATYAGDPDLRGLIDVVPFGVSSEPPAHRRDVLRGVLPGIGDADKILIWGGGLYNWFDPETLIRAVARLTERHPDVRLFFQGTKHPHPGVPEMEIVARSRALAAELGVLDSSVFFNESWVDYDERQNYLTEADAGVSTHFDHIETTYSFRTRVLDYLWAGLPMVLSDGDHFAELAKREGLGVVVPAADVDALVLALVKVLYDVEFRERAKENIARVRETYTWERVLAPLVEFVAEPRAAADRVGAEQARLFRPAARKPRRRTGVAYDLSRTVHYLKNGGPALVAVKVRNRFRRGR